MSENVDLSLRRVIYDLGANNGDDIPYYLKKADVVIAVEANPILVDQIADRFGKEIADGSLFLENRVLVESNGGLNVPFYVHKGSHVNSQLPKPQNIDAFDIVELPSISVAELIGRYGPPYYIKSDLEYYDVQVLRALFAAKIHPPYLSAESHHIDVFALLVAEGYRAFKLVDGYSVSTVYRNHQIDTQSGRAEYYSFPFHSAGPFGNDIFGPWLAPEEFIRVLSFEGLGWKDIHVSLIDEASGRAPRFRNYLGTYAKRYLSGKIRSLMKI